ncbi:MAG: hypothetical protein WDN09_03745 [bacterium]
MMTEEEKAKKIKEIYDEAVAKLDTLARKRSEIVKDYIKELENKKIEALRSNLGL